MDYYSAIKKNDIMPFAATWADIETVILRKEDREGEIPYDRLPLYAESKKKWYK